MSQQKQQKWKEADARKVLERIKQEGTSIPEMARKLGVTPQRIYWWWHRLKDEEPAEVSPKPRFVEVELAVSKRASAPGFTIHARGGRKIEVLAGFDAQELGRLLSVIEGLPC